MTRSIRIGWLAGCLTATVFAGCDLHQKKTVIEPDSPTTSAGEAAPALLARVNGNPIPASRMHDALVRDYGLGVAQQLIADELVRQALERKNLPTDVTDRQIEIENYRAITKIFQFDEDAPTPEQMNSLLDQLLAQKNITRRAWEVTMARNARLARLADRRVKVTDEDLRQEFFARYDGKLKVRHIQVPSMILAQEVSDKAQGGADFEQLAFRYSTNPSGKTGGWLPDIGPRNAPETVPPNLVRAARALKQPGDLSNIVQVGTNFHILKLEEILPPRKVKFNEVKGKLRHLVREKKVDELQPILMKELIDKAQIEYLDPILRARRKQGMTP